MGFTVLYIRISEQNHWSRIRLLFFFTVQNKIKIHVLPKFSFLMSHLFSRNFLRASDSPHCLYSIRMLYTAITQWSLLCPSGSVFFTLWEMRVQHVVALSCPHFSWILGALHIFSAIVQRCIVSNKNIITWQIFWFVMSYNYSCPCFVHVL